MGLRSLAAFSLLLFVASPVPSTSAEIIDLVPVVKKDRIVVSFEMSDAFTEDVEQAIASGLPVSFRYTLQLKKVRSLWFNQTVASRRVVTEVSYDNLTKRYRLSRTIDENLDATEVVSDGEAMRRFMTRFDALDLFDASSLEPNGDYYLRVKGVTRDRNLFLFLPWDIGSAWKKVYFTYLP